MGFSFQLLKGNSVSTITSPQLFPRRVILGRSFFDPEIHGEITSSLSTYQQQLAAQYDKDLAKEIEVEISLNHLDEALKKALLLTDTTFRETMCGLWARELSHQARFDSAIAFLSLKIGRAHV